MSEAVKDAQRKLNEKVMGRPGIAGTAIGQKDGKPCLKVYLSDSKAGTKIPKSIGGFRVVIEKTGGFRRL